MKEITKNKKTRQAFYEINVKIPQRHLILGNVKIP